MNQEPRSPVAPVSLVKREIEINHQRSAAKAFSSSSKERLYYHQLTGKRQPYISMHVW
jgi:hypothetical protein